MNNYNGYYNWYQNNYSQPVLRQFNSENLFPPQEGFDKGNMFSNLYESYKNMNPSKPILQNEQENLLYQIQTICFAAHDLNLYLDIHPEDESMLALFNDYHKKIAELTKNYEQKYGPLTVNKQMNNTFEWATSTWPWEGYNV